MEADHEGIAISGNVTDSHIRVVTVSEDGHKKSDGLGIQCLHCSLFPRLTSSPAALMVDTEPGPGLLPCPRRTRKE